MARYTAEQKSEALAMINDVGVSKTAKAMGISAATLHKWKKEGAVEAPSRPGKRLVAKEKGTSEKAAVESARELLESDDALSDKIQQLEVENAQLRATNAKLRKALAALID